MAAASKTLVKREVKMKKLKYMSMADEAMNKIRKGAFLTVQAADALNTMTIGWAMFGVVWQKPVLMVAVRDSRHTFGLMEKASDFTVTVPSGDLSRETAFCGTKSGRDMDKFKSCTLKTANGQRVASPIIAVPGIHFECRIVYKSAMNPTHLDESYNSTVYPKKDYHTLYFGEVLACYETE
jgi:flavin reductase (DIM6/NTAB) family NADH-FMN oxidoreductase RutF